MGIDPINDILDYVALYVVGGLFSKSQAKKVLTAEIRDYYKSLDKSEKLATLNEWDCSTFHELLSATTSDLSSRYID